jgi:hypothetical protein
MKWEWVASTQNCVQPSPPTSLEASRTKSPAGFSSRRRMLAGLRACEHHGSKPLAYSRRFPALGASALWRVRSRLPLRGSPGFTPGSLELDYFSDQHEARSLVCRASSQGICGKSAYRTMGHDTSPAVPAHPQLAPALRYAASWMTISRRARMPSISRGPGRPIHASGMRYMRSFARAGK